jgi:hypothetical protein
VGDAFGVGGVDFDGERQNQLGFDRLSADAVLQGQAVQKLHGDESLSALLVNLVDGADVGMVQRGGGLRLPLKTAQRLRFLGDFVRAGTSKRRSGATRRPRPCRPHTMPPPPRTSMTR